MLEAAGVRENAKEKDGAEVLQKRQGLKDGKRSFFTINNWRGKVPTSLGVDECLDLG